MFEFLIEIMKSLSDVEFFYNPVAVSLICSVTALFSSFFGRGEVSMITGYFGLPGSGKTTFLTMLAQKELKRISSGRSKYERVYTNFYCFGCYKIDYVELGKYDIRNSLILLDELTLDADSRSFKTFSQEKKMFFIMHRHFNCDIVYFTQQWDGIDKKIRDLTSDLYHVTKCFANVSSFLFRPFQCISVARRVFRTLEINEYTKEIVTGYRFPTLFERFFGRCKQFCFRPHWYKYFDSWDVPFVLPKFFLIPWDIVDS